MIEEQEKKVYFSCPYCFKKYEDPEDMANCTLRCKRSNLEKIAKEEQEKLQKEKQNRREQILATRKELVELERKYRKDYGESLPSIREPITRTMNFNGDWGKFFEDCFK